MSDTPISWTHRPGTRGRSWNPIQGCAMVSEGCRNCYAMRQARRFALDGWSKGLVNLKTGKWTGETKFAAHKLDEPFHWKDPSTVFVNSMSDLFYEGFTNEQIAAVFGIMAATPQHTYLILTKRAKRMREWFAWLNDSTSHGKDTCAEICRREASKVDSVNVEGYDTRWSLPNVWLGVSVENQEAADERIPDLLATPAVVRFLSCEPLLEAVDLRHVQHNREFEVDALTGDHGVHRPLAGRGPRIDWVIAGCESGPGARPCDVAWLRSLRDQCAAAGVPFFLKQAAEEVERCTEGCGQRVSYFADGPTHASASCGCTIEGAESCSPAGIMFGEGSTRKRGNVVELPYLDGVQHGAFPEARP